MTTSLDDVIVAVSTPAGHSHRGIVRLSGAESLSTASAIFFPTNPTCLSELPPYSAVSGMAHLNDGCEAEATVYVMRAPYSYTREDVVEIHTVGAPPLLQMVLETFLEHGARLAEPGEFTRRAFLNGRIDLAQAEAVIQLIRSRADAEQAAALAQLHGDFSKQVDSIRQKLIDLSAEVEADIDFSDQDIDVIGEEELATEIERIQEALAELIGLERGSIPAEGVSAVICGRANVGKSSLFNVLLERSRTIVAPIPGTTRDTIHAAFSHEGITFNLVDSAGIELHLEASECASTSLTDTLERKSTAASLRSARSSEMILFVIDGHEVIDEDMKLFYSIGAANAILVINKSDLGLQETPENQSKRFGDISCVQTAALTSAGIEELKDEMARVVLGGSLDRSTPRFLLTSRHRHLLALAEDALRETLDVARRKLGQEFVALEIRCALDALGEITGGVVTEDVLDRIFAQFCIGK